MQPKGKYERPQNTSLVKQLSKIAVTVHTQYHLSVGPPLYVQYTRCTARSGGVKFGTPSIPYGVSPVAEGAINLGSTLFGDTSSLEGHLHYQGA